MSDRMEPDEATAVALIRAGLRGDLDGVHAIAADCDPAALLGAVSGVTVAIGAQAFGGIAEFDAFLADWQAGK
ncbi:hypothetical protein [Amycolatopsis anabasis]|uniref:hypothetical protein n=1 Tax=Amycolatopsis anabasis TaxID=1840409 RepID=UPI00131E0240|nr:hypothetical protein [Amycolatopsis anabasis]